MTLRIGPVGLDVALSDPQEWSISAGPERIETIRGFIRASSLAESRALRTELANLTGQVVAVTYTTDDSLDGFYRVRFADIDTRHELGSLLGQGFFPFSVELERIGSESSTEFRSILSGTVRDNSKGLTAANVDFWHAVPVGTLAYDAGGAMPTAIYRDSEDGDVPTLIGVDRTVDPSWRCSPANFYRAACYVKVGGRLRTGVDVKNDPADWEVGNKILKVTPGTTGGASNGRIVVSHWDGTQYDAKTYKFLYAATTVVPEWHYMTVLHSTPEVVRFRLVRDADEANPTTNRHVLDLELRRGALFVNGKYDYSAHQTNWKVARDSPEAAVTVTPGAASAPVAIQASVADGNGNKFVIRSALSFTADTTNGGLTFASVRRFSFFLGCVVGTPQNGDDADDQCLQYMAPLGERVEAIRG